MLKLWFLIIPIISIQASFFNGFEINAKIIKECSQGECNRCNAPINKWSDCPSEECLFGMCITNSTGSLYCPCSFIQSKDEIEDEIEDEINRPPPMTRPTTPMTRPTTPMTKPTTPMTKPTTPMTRPTTPMTRPTTPMTRPTTPMTRPTTPMTRPTTPMTTPKKPLRKKYT
jgi:hypothetical protein